MEEARICKIKEFPTIFHSQRLEDRQFSTPKLRSGSPSTPPMAEAAGLVLGAVALASLFQTAVEFLEYFEVARNSQADRRIATTKINLLEVRLKQWGRDLGIHEVGQECDGWLRERLHYLEEGGIIAECLVGISSILGNASELSKKYGLDKRKRLSWSSLSFRSTRLGQEPRRQASNARACCPRAFPIINIPRNTASLGSKVTWAVRDKKKFESLILELDFLVTNLERVSDHLRRPSTPSSCFSSSQTLSLSPDQGIPRPFQIWHIEMA